ncbi:MAG TPA: polysaccharide deacetylase family protein [Accumulibacter sp.]|nr:polysaccharide deacetylase family protein [Accumulibacter sp.]HMX23546.1 polysaccharide deacetylase family protein [Accumulibacter sp.]HNC17183.1 polysaccharide deacetylase family protein [Accumulibacter sp.]HND81212.1 polysaccharide deacetylase family protein [Accumulibacter sp.]HNH24391.1 polysaccharide deacetylase family protein [Accumulibacter sp.]
MPFAWDSRHTVHLSVATHAAAAVGAWASPAEWPLALGAVGANHLLLGAAGMFPRSTLLGPNLNRLPAAAQQRREVALTIDDGPDPEVTPRVLDLLDAAGARATFFCIGRRARQTPALCREIVARGHRVENHGDSHSWAFATFGPRRILADLRAAQATLADITAQAPEFFRPTAGLRNPLLDPVLRKLGLRLASWTHRSLDSLQGDPQRVYQRLRRNLAPGDILLMHDGYAARTPRGAAVIVEVLPRLLQTLRDEDLRPVTLAAAVR